MKAMVYARYGPPEVLYLKEVETPMPKKNEVLVKILATTVNSGDLRMRKADPFFIRVIFGLFRPGKKILGFTLSGIVEAVGSEVKELKEGDAVFGITGFSFGGWAEYNCVPGKYMVIKPQSISYEEAAAIPFGGNTALFYLKKAKVRSGQKLMIYGASGSTGTSAVQLAKYFGATVTAVCSTSNIDMMHSIGADSIIDYTKEDFASGDTTYDVVFDAVGKIKKKQIRKILCPGGVFVSVSQGLARSKREDLVFLKDLAAEGKLKPVIDKVWPLEQMVEAHQYADKGHKKGNIVITVHHNQPN